MLNLNHEQQRVKEAIEAAQSGDRLVVSGRAGSGKTFAIANSVAERKALFLTPTHTARSVLERELPSRAHRVSTIHSAIGWYQRRDENLEKVDGYLPAQEALSRHQKASAMQPGAFLAADIIIVDEFSMVGSSLFDAIEEYANAFDLPVIYSGDHFQLPPVRDREVIMKQGYDTITLQNSMRFSKESEIYKFGEHLRHYIEHRPDDDLPCLIGGRDVSVLPSQLWMDGFALEYGECKSVLGVTSDNKTLRRLRRKVRKVDYDHLTGGDLVISKQTDGLFQNGEQFVISEAVRTTHVLENVPGCVSQKGSLKLEGFAVRFLETDRVASTLVDETDATELSDRVRRLFGKGKLDRAEACRILDWIDELNRFELAALATVHKSQGRTVDTVYIDTGTVLKRPDWLSAVHHKRLLYTAVTRARKHVRFYDMPTYCQLSAPDQPHGKVQGLAFV